MIYNYYLCLGSNIGHRILYFKSALEKLKKYGTVIRKSSIYLTQPWGNKNQPEFYNAMVQYHSKLYPEKLLATIKKIEYEIGRSKSDHWGAREIDIDIVFCTGITMNRKNLHIPHREFSSRLFVLTLMAELDESYVVDGTEKTIKYFLQNCNDKLKLEKVDLKW